MSRGDGPRRSPAITGTPFQLRRRKLSGLVVSYKPIRDLPETPVKRICGEGLWSRLRATIYAVSPQEVGEFAIRGEGCERADARRRLATALPLWAWLEDKEGVD